MASSRPDRSNNAEDDKARWFREQRLQRSRILKGEFDRAGRDAWNAATASGADVVARTPEEVRALGGRILDAGNQAMANPKGPASTTNGGNRPAARADAGGEQVYAQRRADPWDVGNDLREGLLQADTAVRGAANQLTFGGADHLAAGMDALIEPGGIGGWHGRYQAELAREQARNRYDAIHRPIAQTLGELGGTALGLGVGPMEGALAAAPRLAGAAKLTAREAAAIVGGGGLAGLGGQAVSDLATNSTSSIGDKMGAALGGMAGGGTAIFVGPANAGSADAFVTSATQDLFNGRPFSLERAERSAIAGHALGGLAGIAGRNGSNALSRAAKGRLGEWLGELRSSINLQPRDWVSKSRDYLPGGRYWIPDGRRGSVRFEDKFGVSADLSPMQKRAQALLGTDFHLNSFLPADIGKMFGVPAASAAPHLTDQQHR